MGTLQQIRKFVSEVFEICTKYLKEAVKNLKTDTERRSKQETLNICDANPVDLTFTRSAAVRPQHRAAAQTAQFTSANMKLGAKQRYGADGPDEADLQPE